MKRSNADSLRACSLEPPEAPAARYRDRRRRLLGGTALCCRNVDIGRSATVSPRHARRRSGDAERSLPRSEKCGAAIAHADGMGAGRRRSWRRGVMSVVIATTAISLLVTIVLVDTSTACPSSKPSASRRSTFMGTTPLRDDQELVLPYASSDSSSHMTCGEIRVRASASMSADTGQEWASHRTATSGGSVRPDIAVDSSTRIDSLQP